MYLDNPGSYIKIMLYYKRNITHVLFCLQVVCNQTACDCTGIKGDRGSPGSPGMPGPQGDYGDDGPEGRMGRMGEHGDSGERGDYGDKGQRVGNSFTFHY